MLGQHVTSAASSADSRIFVYEVAGLSQNERTAQRQPPIRSSQNQLFQVPFHRMNKEMRRITMLGGEIINISPLGDSTPPSTASKPTEKN